MNFLCSYPMLFTAGMCDVMYIRAYNTYLHSKCSLSTLYNDIRVICLMSTQSALLFVSSDSNSHAYATSRSSSLRTDHYTACRNTACSVCACAAKTHDTAVGLGLPFEMPLAVKFSCCEWIIDSKMRISRKFLCVILPPHDLCIRNAFKMVMSVR